ncbi:M4 family metallopeptidase [Streptomyces poonensis]|uniref:Neutral metalloproteinase n=1 Tax=Streptomyces poonensis TaxID=68255 RepID=A0A918UCM0_9ACTN|nr:M4 family metallopeptidase [Streptomyces poonensis]GGY87678.1 peptidase [Streptomyces poonensis]GLJ90251.1 peptidase [Streptomyces poonensis]
MTPFYARHKRTTLAIATAVAAGALLAAGTTTGAAAQPEPSPGTAKAAALPLALTPAARTALIKEADADAATTADAIGLGAKEELVVRDVVQDADGTTHTRYERTYAGLPVLGGDLVVHANAAGTTTGVTKATKAAVKVADLTPDVTKAAAEKQALKAAKAEGSTESAADRAPRKVVWAATGEPVLAYETVVGGFQHDGTPQELHVVTDAATGEKLYEWEAVQTATGHGQYNGTVTINTTLSGSTYQLNDSARGAHKTYNKARSTSSSLGTLFTDADNVWGTGTPSSATTDQTAAVDAHYGAQATWDFYKNVLGRNGIRNNGVAAPSRVHYGNAYVNAFWSDSCFCMTYGDGSGNVKPLTSLDVAAHEMTHGVTSNTAGLNYSGESGGLNEATSDILAAAVEFHAGNAADPGDYLIGEKIDINGNGTPLRYMDKPSKDGKSADYWSSSLAGMDVHYSSGPANHFFYLLSEGSGAKTVNGVSYNSPTSNGSTVTGIGRTKAIQIWYKALTTYMTSTTNYKGARTATLNAAAALYGSGSAEYNAVNTAWAAVNVTA